MVIFKKIFINDKLIIKIIKIKNFKKYDYFLKKLNYITYFNLILSYLNKNKCYLIEIKNKINKKKKLNLNIYYIFNKIKYIMSNIKIFIILDKNLILKINEKYIILNKK
ncbi:MAG: hypothetical protein NHG07_00130 [Candidatus Shikimatogenerans bostrichidophilus]|nr:MAG: hypothetical protein NHG07_00130 [Candidatus Shikimatogenerans bostrichidophilus]